MNIWVELKNLVGYEIIHTENIHISVLNILVVLLTFLFTLLLLRLIRKALKRYEKKEGVDEGSLISIFQIIKYLIWVITIGFVISQLGFKLNILIASSAALLVGLGFGIQQIFNDYISGILILLEHNIKVGDILEIENEKVGKVLKIGLRTSKIKTRDDIIVVIPNSKLISENTINWSHMVGKTRFHVNVGVAYGSNTRLVKQVLLSCADKIEDISKTPVPFVRFQEFGDSSLNFQLFFWTKNTFYVENIKSDLRFLIDDEFRNNNIQIPFPQRDIHIIDNNKGNNI